MCIRDRYQRRVRGSDHKRMAGLVDASNPEEQLRALQQAPPVELDLTQAFNLTDEMLEAAVPHLVNLTQLDMSGLSEITNKALIVIGDGCKNLQHLKLRRCRGISDAGVSGLIARCPKLKFVSLSGSPRLTEGLVHTMARTLPELEELELDQSCLISDGSILQALGDGCPQLHRMLLSGHFEMPCSAVNDLAFHCPHLRMLNLAQCSMLDDEAIASLSRFCQQLEDLDLTMCSDVTDNGIGALAQGCPKLSTLRLYGLDGVSNQGVKALCDGFPQLGILDLSFCDSVSDPSLDCLGSQCRQLRELMLEGCGLITKEAVERLTQVCPNVVVRTESCELSCSGAYGSMMDWDQQSEIVPKDIDWSLLPM
eukprot:TRINITY_DN2543_c0_g1_i6.p1 TRINITY_DN2543_c0_g1~~TRINITY_DN2543_c0_g1_i6.p1  ORF type:complete len:367 (-),score=84.24 TRINITY_DN2543_c0_g1_i6:139-1239(-)